jgi:branched-chain amino acid aminotransferase
MPTLVNIDRKIFARDEARVSVFDRGFLFGDSVYEVLRTYGGRLFAFDLHADRLARSAAQISFALPFSRERLLHEIRRTVDAAGNRESYVRVVVTRGSGKIGMDPVHARRPCTIVIVERFDPPPAALARRATGAALVSRRRNPKNSLSPSIKSGNYLNNVLAQIEARAAGAAEAVMLNTGGYVAEGTVFNVFMVERGAALTPPLSAGILDGITRRLLIRHGRRAGVDMREVNIRGSRLLSADEVFLTSTLREVQPVTSLNDRPVGNGKPGPVTARLAALFSRLVPEYLS